MVSKLEALIKKKYKKQYPSHEEYGKQLFYYFKIGIDNSIMSVVYKNRVIDDKLGYIRTDAIVVIVEYEPSREKISIIEKKTYSSDDYQKYKGQPEGPVYTMMGDAYTYARRAVGIKW
jgi:hypothetical protein